MTVLFRADANREIGQGHVMRCLSVADAFADKGVTCKFVCAEDSYTETIEKRGFAVLRLETSYNETEKELPAFLKIIDEERAEFVFVDSYYVTPDYLQKVKEASHTVYLDDVYAFAYPVDTLINYNVYASYEQYKALYEREGVSLPDMLLKPLYAPLRKEFEGIEKREQADNVKTVLVSFGGADPLHMAAKFADGLKTREDLTKNYVFHMILGAMEPDLDALKALAEEAEWLKVSVNVRNMKEVLLNSDIAISAAGSTQYEICACQVPGINFSMADNQLPGGEEFGRLGIYRYVGDVRYEEDFYGKIYDAVKELAGNKSLREEMAEKERNLLDGCGAKRIAGYFLKRDVR